MSVSHLVPLSQLDSSSSQPGSLKGVGLSVSSSPMLLSLVMPLKSLLVSMSQAPISCPLYTEGLLPASLQIRQKGLLGPDDGLPRLSCLLLLNGLSPLPLLLNDLSPLPLSEDLYFDLWYLDSLPMKLPE